MTPHPGRAPDAACREARAGQIPSSPLIGVKRPEIRFLHENSKNIPAGSNPSKRHLADRGIVVPSDQERKTGPITAIQIKTIPGQVDTERSPSSGGGAAIESAFPSLARSLVRAGLCS